MNPDQATRTDTVRTPEDTTPTSPDTDPPTPTLTSPDTVRTSPDTLHCRWCSRELTPDSGIKWWDDRPQCPERDETACFHRAYARARALVYGQEPS
ncbi:MULTISPECIES: hypothetical protein [Streptomyces]|uniref:hypothetical protein n=1 Tax=Streptomyces TaxID=1883 RepID=UPI00345C21CD